VTKVSSSFAFLLTALYPFAFHTTMAVTISNKDRAKKAKQTPVEPAPDLSHYVAPREGSEGVKAFAIWMVGMLVLCAGLTLSPLQGVGIGIFIWWLTAVLAYFVIAPRLMLRRLHLHPEDKITSRKHPRLDTVLSKGSAMVGIPEPEGYVEEEGHPQVQILGNKPPFFLHVTQAGVDMLQPAELDCLALRCLVHTRQGHVRRLSLLRFLNGTPPAARILAWPVLIYAVLLRTGWQEQAEQTADRLTLLLVKNSKLLISAILKQVVATDPEIVAQNITSQDVDNYIKQSGLISASGSEILTQYKMGSAIHDNPYLEQRIQSLRDWGNSPEYAAALEKLAQARSPKA
jgi:hypothetical protein